MNRRKFFGFIAMTPMAFMAKPKIEGNWSTPVNLDEPVFTDNFYVGVNQRAKYRWVAAPGSEIVWPLKEEE